MVVKDVWKEKTEAENQLYAVINPILAQYETRGYNAHQRAQIIVAETVRRMDAWIRQQQLRTAMDNGGEATIQVAEGDTANVPVSIKVEV